MNPETVPHRLAVAALTGRIKLQSYADPRSPRLVALKRALRRAERDLERAKQLNLNLTIP